MRDSILKLVFLCVSTVGCSPTYFSSVIKTFDGEELTSESCTEEKIDYLKLLQKGIQKDSDTHRLGSDIYQLMSEGHTLSERWVEKIRQVWREHDFLQHRANTGKKPHLKPEIITLDETSFRIADQHIRTFEEAIDLLEDSEDDSDISRSEKNRFRTLEEREQLSADLTSLLAEYFGDLTDFCQFLGGGYQLTERGRKLATYLEPLYLDYNKLLSKRIQTSQLNKQILIKKQLLNILKDIRYLQKEIKKEFIEDLNAL